jgi:hypothetical protein
MRPPDNLSRLFVGMCLAGGLGLLLLGAGLAPFSDEWAYIESRALTDPGTWLRPHNEHWTTIPILAYRAIVETVGLGSYVPFHALLVATHLLVVGLVYAHVRRTSGPPVAFAVGAVLLLFGSGFENLYWAFQVTFIGAVAFGLAAMWVFDEEPLRPARLAVGTLLVMASMATSGIGLIYGLAVGLELLLDPRRRKAAFVLAIPVAVYAIWYLAIGRVGIEEHEGAFSLGGLEDLAPSIYVGMTTTAGALAGVGPDFGWLVIAVLAIAGVAWAVGQRRLALHPRFVGCVTAAVALYALIALARSFVGPDVAQYTRYTYLSAVLLVVGIAAQVGQPRLPAAGTPRLVFLGAAAAVLTLSLLWNVRLLFAGRELFIERATATRALLIVAFERPLPATTDPDRSLVLVPSPNSLDRIEAAFGLPIGDSLVPWAVRPPTTEQLTAARQTLAEGAEIPLPSE